MQKKQFEYTLNMETIFQGKLSELKSYYCREDYARALSAVDKASKDSKKFRMRDLKRLCDARDINADAIIGDRTLLEQIPTREQMQSDLLESFYDMYKNAPNTSGYMERIVRRLAPEYSDDTVRVAILKKFVLGSGVNFKRFNIKSIYAWARERFSTEEKTTFENSGEQEQKELVVSKLDDSIFNQGAIELTNADVLVLIADRIEKYVNDRSVGIDGIVLNDNTKRMLAELLNVYGSFVEGQSDTELVQSVVNAIKMGDIPEKCINGESALTDAVEKDFREQLKAIKRVSKTGKEGTAADLYKQAKKDAVKAKKNAAKKNSIDFELLDLCNDLAEGNFRVNGKTKVHLYYFAFMFEMTIPINGKAYDPARDVVKNLFEDFYHDNLLRLLSGAYADPKSAGSVENEPTGEGINYKNFVEAIYIYFLCRDDLEFTPGQRIDKAEEIIENCVKLSKSTGKTGQMKAGTHTNVYRDTHLNVLLNKTMEEIPDYILNHYLVVSPDNIGSARIMVASEEITASDYVDELVEYLDDTYDDIEVFDIIQRNDMTNERKDDIAFKTDSGFDWKVKDLLEARYSSDTEFMKVVSELDSRVRIHNGRYSKNERARMLTLLHVLFTHSSENSAMSTYKVQARMEEKGVVCVSSQFSEAIAALRAIGFDIQKSGDNFYLGERDYSDNELKTLLKCVSDRYYRVTDESDYRLSVLLVERLGVNRRITRNNLIALHLSYYISTLDEEGELDTFPDVFDNYADSINEYLEEARYQPLSEKNIFDMYVVTALYFYLVVNNGYMYVKK